MNNQRDKKDVPDSSRRDFLAVGSSVLASAALTGVTMRAQEPQDTRKAEKDIPPATLARKTGRCSARIQVPICRRRQITETWVQSGTPLTWRTSASRRAAGRTR